MLKDLSDEQLVARIVKGQETGLDVEEEFTELYRRYSTYIKKIVRSIAKSSSLSMEEEDITQEVFRKLFNSGLHQYEGRKEASFRTFLATITKNVLMDKLRAKSRQDQAAQKITDEMSAAEKDQLEEQDTPAEIVQRRERLQLIMNALKNLVHTDFLDAVVIVLSNWGKMTDREIGSLFDMTEDSLHKWRHRAYDKLKQVFKQRFPNLHPEDVL